MTVDERLYRLDFLVTFMVQHVLTDEQAALLRTMVTPEVKKDEKID